jgi:histone-lysine N-methyltransferase SETMAR
MYPHTATVTTGTLEEMQREVLAHPAYSPYLAPSNFHLFSPLKETLGGKILRANDEVKLILKLPE